MHSSEKNAAIIKNQPLISIITVTFNAAMDIERCINSVRNQHYKNTEHIIIDGGSTDGTLEIIKKHDQYLSCWISEPDNGIYDAMNKGVKKAKGDWLYFMGADDQLLDGFSEMAAKLADPSSIYFGDVSYAGIRSHSDNYTAYQLAKANICHQAIFYPKKVFMYHAYDCKYHLFADWVFNLRLWADKRFKFRFYSFVIAEFGMHGATSETIDKRFYEDRSSIIKSTLGYWIFLRIKYKEYRKRKGGHIQLLLL